MKKTLATAVLGLAFLVAGCGAENVEAAPQTDAAPAVEQAPPGEAPAAAAAPATGNVIEVRMITDHRGSYYEPAAVTASRGDVVRFILDSGVHNTSFPADKNAGKSGLPGMGPMLQVPGQTYDVPVTFEPGEYTFQCDPHVPLGMFGTLTVE